MNLNRRLTKIEKLIVPNPPDQKPTVFNAETVQAYREVVEACVEHLDSRFTSALCNSRALGDDDIQGQGRYWAKKLASVYLHLKYCGEPEEIEIVRNVKDPRMAPIIQLVQPILAKMGEEK